MNAAPVSAAQMEFVLIQALQPESVTVTDDTADHMGHAGHSGAPSGTHFTIQIRGRCFNGLSHVQRHRLVYDSLQEFLDQGLHALAIEFR